MVSRNSKNRKKRGHVSAGHGRIGMFISHKPRICALVKVGCE